MKLKSLIERIILQEMKNLNESSGIIYADVDSQSEFQEFFDQNGSIFGDERGVTDVGNIQHPEVKDWLKFWDKTKNSGKILIDFGNDNYRNEDDFIYELKGKIYWYDWSEGYMAVLDSKMKSKLMTFAKQFAIDEEEDY